MPKKHRDSKRVGYETIYLRTLKTLTRHALAAYNDSVGCSYTIQYPHGEGVTTDLLPCFLAPDTLLECQ
ncbi:hypothetical protein [Bartonella sp. B39]